MHTWKVHCTVFRHEWTSKISDMSTARVCKYCVHTLSMKYYSIFNKNAQTVWTCTVITLYLGLQAIFWLVFTLFQFFPHLNLHSFKNPDLHLARSNSPCSQLLPENPSMQVQLYLQPCIPWHVALFKHGLDWHGLQIPVIRRKNMGLGNRQKLTRIKDLKKEENIAWLKAF